MLKTLDLVKVFLFEAFNLNKLKIKNKKGKSKLVSTSIIIAAVLILYGYIFVNMFISILVLSKTQDISIDQLLLLPMTLISITALMFIFLSGNLLSFSEKDTSILGPLPIDEKKVVGAKLIVAYIFECVFQVFLGISTIIAYAIVGPVSLVGILSLILVMFLSSVVPMVLFSFVILVLRRIIQKSKYRKALELVGGLFSILLILAFSFGFNFITGFAGEDGANAISMLLVSIKKVLNFVPFLFFIKLAIDNNHIIFVLLYVISTSLLMYLFVIIFNKFAYRLMLNYKYTREEKQRGPVEYKKKNINLFLIKKEFKRMFSSNIYLVNIMMVPIMLIIGSIIIIFLPQMQEISKEIPQFGAYMTAVMIFFNILFIFTPAITMSLEGKYLWIIKSMPLENSTIFKAKIYFNMILQIVSSLIILILLSIAFSLSYIWILCLILFIIASSFGTSVYYLRLNLKHPKLDATDMIIIKQSAPVMIMALTTFLIIGAEVLIYAVLTIVVTGEAAILMMAALNAFIGVLYAFSLKKKGNKLFESFY